MFCRLEYFQKMSKNNDLSDYRYWEAVKVSPTLRIKYFLFYYSMNLLYHSFSIILIDKKKTSKSFPLLQTLVI